MLSERDVSFIKEYVNDRYFDCEKLIKYLSLHDVVGNEVFSHCDKNTSHKSNTTKSYTQWLDDEWGYEPLPVDRFIRRIPFYFYTTKDENHKVGYLHHIISGVIGFNDKKPDLEQIYSILEFMFYETGLSLDDIFNYTVEQTHQVSQNNILLQWNHYLHLCSDLKINDPTPECFITRYNEILERSGMPPIIYEICDIGVGEYFWRTGIQMQFEGVFPCDKNGNPIMRWIGLRVNKATSISCKQDKSSRGRLYIELLPDTIIHALNVYNSKDDEDTWYQLYAGPLTMEFDNEAIRAARKRLKYSQKMVADAVGASVRTYQKWESGETEPDGHYLLRLLNWLDLPSVQDVTRYTE